MSTLSYKEQERTRILSQSPIELIRQEDWVQWLVYLQEIFYADRPVMEQHNQDINKILSLLCKEIRELNGHAEDNMTLEQYRKQEVADIYLFSSAVLRFLDVKYTRIELDTIAQYKYGVTPREKVVDESVIKDTYTEEYERLKAELKQIRRQLILMRRCKNLDGLSIVIMTVAGLSNALFSILGTTTAYEVPEKVGRNHLKYEAKSFNNKEYLLGKKESVNDFNRVSEHNPQGVNANAEFYSPYQTGYARKFDRLEAVTS